MIVVLLMLFSQGTYSRCFAFSYPSIGLPTSSRGFHAQRIKPPSELRYSSNDDSSAGDASKNLLADLHQRILFRDPTWYQTYVIDVLGKEYAESTMNMKLEQAKELEAQRVEERIHRQKIRDDEKARRRALTEVEQKQKEAEEIAIKKEEEEQKKLQEQAAAQKRKEEEEEELRLKKIEEEKIEKKKVEEQKRLQEQAVAQKKKEEEELRLKKVEEEKIKKRREQEEKKLQEQTATQKRKEEEVRAKKIEGDKRQVQDKEEEQKIRQGQHESDRLAAVVAEATEKRATRNTTGAVDSGVNTNRQNENVSDSSEKMAVYMDMAGKLQAIPLNNLTSTLGYGQEEITKLQADALAVIINDGITRPKVGIPPQWKYNSERDPVSQQVKLVDTLEEAEKLIRVAQDSSRTKESSTRDRAQQSSATQATTPQRDQVREPSPQSTSQKQNPTTRRKRDASEEKKKVPRKQRRSSKEPPPDIPRERKTRRTGTRDDGTPKRIYSGRETRPRNPTTVRSDPPKPDFPLWVDMDTFRNLLRTEADLRLRILGDDWANTVKSESKWRLNLYKNWLWMLHNGVGEDPLVPPSRTERARRQAAVFKNKNPETRNKSRREKAQPQSDEPSRSRDTKNRRRRPADD